MPDDRRPLPTLPAATRVALPYPLRVGPRRLHRAAGAGTGRESERGATSRRLADADRSPHDPAQRFCARRRGGAGAGGARRGGAAVADGRLAGARRERTGESLEETVGGGSPRRVCPRPPAAAALHAGAADREPLAAAVQQPPRPDGRLVSADPFSGATGVLRGRLPRREDAPARSAFLPGLYCLAATAGSAGGGAVLAGGAGRLHRANPAGDR